MVGNGKDGCLLDLLPAASAEYDPALALDRCQRSEELRRALDRLRPQQQQVMVLRFGLADGQARTLEEVGRCLKVTRERARQVEQKTLARLRQSRALTAYAE